MKVHTTKQEILKDSVELSKYLGVELQNCESEIVLKDHILYKVIDENFRNQKKPIMEFLHDINHQLPIDIYDLFYENGHFFAYSMEFYEQYNTLYHLLNSSISLQERKQIAKELIQLYKQLLDLKIIYFDWHSKNVLYHDILKLLDIDSGKMTCSSRYDAIARRNLFCLCLSLLIGIDLDFDLRLGEYSQKSLLYELFSNEEVALCETMPLDLAYMEQTIDTFTSTMVDCQKELILKY